MEDEASVFVYRQDAYVIAGDASCIQDEEDEDHESDFDGVLRLAGWNATEYGIQIILGRRSGLWCFQTGDAEYPAVPEAAAESLVALFERGAAGSAPRRMLRPLAIDRNWLVEDVGTSTSQVVRFDVIAADQWPMVNAAMAIARAE